MPTPLEQNITWAQKAVGFVRSRIKTAGNVPQDVHDYAATHFAGQAATAIDAGIEAVRNRAAGIYGASIQRLIPPGADPAHATDAIVRDLSDHEQLQLRRRATTAAAANSQFGNCDEMATLAYEFLKDANEVGPVEMVTFTSEDDAYDHVWVMIGRDIHGHGFKERDPTTWGEEAVWCDPWQRTGSLLGRVYSIAAWRSREVDPPPDPNFRLDTVANVRNGWPSGINRCHTNR